MEELFDYSEVTRRIDKNSFMVYYDQSKTYLNFVIKVRELLENCEISKETFRDKIELLNGELKRQEKELFIKHYHLQSPPPSDI